MRRLVFPWHRQIVDAAHAAGKPAVLHSCGHLNPVMDVIIDTIGYDGKHSFEDVIQPVEEAYEQYSKRISIMGGLDLDYCFTGLPASYSLRTSMSEKALPRNLTSAMRPRKLSPLGVGP